MTVATRYKFVYIFLLLTAALTLPILSHAEVRVKGYFRKNGTYVAPHVRSSPNSTKLDNWSTKGNINPYTGKLGTKNTYEYSGSSSGKLPNVVPNNLYLFNQNQKIDSSQTAPDLQVAPSIYEEAVRACSYNQTAYCIRNKIQNITSLMELKKEMQLADTTTQAYYESAKRECSYNLTPYCIKNKMQNYQALDQQAYEMNLASDDTKVIYLKAKRDCSYSLTPYCIRSKMQNYTSLEALEKEMFASDAKTRQYYQKAKNDCSYNLTPYCIKSKMQNQAALEELEDSVYNRPN